MDVVGGNVNRTVWETEAEEQVDDLFTSRSRRGADIDMHLDNSDNPSLLPFLTCAGRRSNTVTREGDGGAYSFADRSAGPGGSPGNRSGERGRTQRLRPSQPDSPSRVRELMEAGVNVTCGTDNMQDAFVGVGNGDLLEAILLLAQVTRDGL